MGDLTCSNPNSCHPFLFTFGLFTVILMALYLVRDTFFDNAQPKRGPILSPFNTAISRQPPVSQAPVPGAAAVNFTDEGADGFRALRYEDTQGGDVRRSTSCVGGGSPKCPISPIPDPEKVMQSPVREQADPNLRAADIAGEAPKFEDAGYGNFKHVKSFTGERRSETLKHDRREPLQTDLDYRPATFVDEGPDGFQAMGNPYTWDPVDLDKGNNPYTWNTVDLDKEKEVKKYVEQV